MLIFREVGCDLYTRQPCVEAMNRHHQRSQNHLPRPRRHDGGDGGGGDGDDDARIHDRGDRGYGRGRGRDHGHDRGDDRKNDRGRGRSHGHGHDGHSSHDHDHVHGLSSRSYNPHCPHTGDNFPDLCSLLSEDTQSARPHLEINGTLTFSSAAAESVDQDKR